MDEPKNPFFEYAAMYGRGSPVSLIIESFKTLKAEGFEVSALDLETHFLQKGRLEDVVELLVSAKAEGKRLSWMEACGLDLVASVNGTRCLEYLKRSLESRLFVFSSYGKEHMPMAGITLNKEEVRATVRFRYYYPLTGFEIDEEFVSLREELGAFLYREIHMARSFDEFLEKEDEAVDSLIRIAQEDLSTIYHLEISLRRS